MIFARSKLLGQIELNTWCWCHTVIRKQQAASHTLTQWSKIIKFGSHDKIEIMNRFYGSKIRLGKIKNVFVQTEFCLVFVSHGNFITASCIAHAD